MEVVHMQGARLAPGSNDYEIKNVDPDEDFPYSDGYKKLDRVVPKGYGRHVRYELLSENTEFIQLYSLREPDSKKSYRMTKIEEGYHYKGKVFQIDENSRLSMLGKALQLQLNSRDTSVDWITKDNTIYTFTSEEFIKFTKDMADYYEQIILGSHRDFN